MQPRDTIIENANLGWWQDEEGCFICHQCKCPLLMHTNTLGCGAKKDACQNPECCNKYGSNETPT